MRKTSSLLIAAVMVLLALGIVMLASTSSIQGMRIYDDPSFYVKRQFVWLGIGLIFGLIAACFRYHYWLRLAVPMAALSGVSLLLVRLIGTEINGSYRWFRFGSLSFQPSEVAKFSVIILLSWWMSRLGARVREFRKGWLVPTFVLIVVCGLLLIEPDYGTMVLLGLVGMGVMFAGGTRWWLVFLNMIVGGGAVVGLLLGNENRRLRLLAFMDPDKYPVQAYHLIQSKAALIRGELTGVGLGNSIQKHAYLPEAHTDFILPIIGEELGFLATALIVVLFMVIVICGLIISYKAPDVFGRLIAFGITSMLGFQACINVAVVTGCMPTKGLALPFISYGGSSLIVSLVFIGVLLNIASQCETEEESEHIRAVNDGVHQF